MPPIACWTWWWPPSRPKHVVQLTTLLQITTCCVLTSLHCTFMLHTQRDASTQDDSAGESLSTRGKKHVSLCPTHIPRVLARLIPARRRQRLETKPPETWQGRCPYLRHSYDVLCWELSKCCMFRSNTSLLNVTTVLSTIIINFNIFLPCVFLQSTYLPTDAHWYAIYDTLSTPTCFGTSVPKHVGVDNRSGYMYVYYTDPSYCLRTTQSHNIATPTHQRTSTGLSQTCHNMIQTSEIENIIIIIIIIIIMKLC